MSIDQLKTIDLMGSNPGSNVLDLFITDHLPWDKTTEYEHAYKLQEKVNAYLAAIETGELFEQYPEHKGKSVVISVLGKYELNTFAKEFYKKVSGVVKGAGFELKFKFSP
jgi:hypothetical protein